MGSVKNLVKKDKAAHCEGLVAEARVAAGAGDARTLHRLVRLLSKAKPEQVLRVKGEDGQLLREPLAVRRRWREHFVGLLHAEEKPAVELLAVAAAEAKTARENGLAEGVTWCCASLRATSPGPLVR